MTIIETNEFGFEVDYYTIPKEIANKYYYNLEAFELACWAIDIFFLDRIKASKLISLANKYEEATKDKPKFYNSQRTLSMNYSGNNL